MKNKLHITVSIILVCVFAFGILYNLSDCPELMKTLLIVGFLIFILPKWIEEIRGWFKDIAKDAIKEMRKQ